MSPGPSLVPNAADAPLTPYRPLTSVDWDDRFSQAVIISAIVHIVFIFGLHFKAANPKLFESTLPIEVVLVNTRTQEAPLKPELLAQANLDAGGDVEAPRQAKSPLPASPQDSPASEAEAATAQVQALENQARQLMQQLKSSYSVPEAAPQPEAEPRPPEPSPEPANLAARSLEMARLAARIDNSWDEYQKTPRRAFVGARAQEFAFARYVNDWRIKVERYGNSNYPEAARRQGIYGALVLTVGIRSDGSVLSVQVDRSSGSRVLDAAAVKIVENAGPYAPFQMDMRKRVDELYITRTWTFTRSDQLTSQ